MRTLSCTASVALAIAATAMLAAAILERNPGEQVVHNLICSKAVPEIVRELGGTPIRTRVGHSFIKQVMAETGAIFGGEHSAHYYFRDNFYADNGFIPALLILELMSKKGQSLQELLAPLAARYFISGEINTKLPHMDVVGPKLEEISKKYSDGQQSRLDGLSVEYPDWHFNVRPSNTEPLLRLNLEAVGDEAEMEAKRDEVLAVGGARPAADSFRAFRGRDPQVDALLRHNGMISA